MALGDVSHTAAALGRWAAVFVLAASAGCSPLTDIDAGVCGNLVLEPSSTEDCDGFAVDGIPCYAPGTPNQCRLDCTGDGSTHPCPEGWACGGDFVCRTPTGRFERIGAPLAESAFFFAFGDFDADKRKDLLSSTSADIRIHYQEPGEVLGQTLVIPTTGTYPSVGDANGDGIDDFTMNVGLGVGIMLGQKNRTTTPASFPALQVPKNINNVTVNRARLISIQNPSASLADSLFLVAEVAGTGWMLAAANLEGSGSPVDFSATLPLSTDGSLPFPGVAKGRIAADPFQLQCEQLALAFAGKSTVDIHLPCTRGLMNSVKVDLLNQPAPFPFTVNLPATSRVAGRIFLVDVNRDDMLDLVVPAESSAPCGIGMQKCYELDIAYGMRDGSFHDNPIEPATLPGNGQAVFYARLKVGPTPPGSTATVEGFLPLAVGDLDGDGMLDYVDAFAVNVARKMIGQMDIDYARTFSNTSADSWTDAMIADFNNNGLLDVIAGASTKADIDFLNGTGTDVLNPYRITTLAGVDQFTLGDFDGDLILDLAFAQGSIVTAGGDIPRRSVGVSFGRSSGAPETPVIVGHFESIGQVVGLNYGSADAMTDLGILYAEETSFFLNLAFGSSIRQIQAPFTLVDYLKGIIHVPLRSFLGRFGGQGPADLAALTAGITSGIGSNVDYRSGLWLAPSNAEGEIDNQAAKGSSELDARNVFFTGPTLGLIDGIVVDLDHDQLDELVLSLPIVGDPGGPNAPPKLWGGLTVARVDGGAWKLDDALAPEEARFFLSFKTDDINADSFADIAALGVTLQRDMQGAVTGYTTQIAVFWGDTGGLKAPVLVDPPADPGSTSGFHPTALALLNVDGDSAKEIIAITDNDAFLIDTDATGALPAPVLIETLPGGIQVAASDLTSDGVDDLVVGGNGSTYVFRGIPVLP